MNQKKHNSQTIHSWKSLVKEQGYVLNDEEENEVVDVED